MNRGLRQFAGLLLGALGIVPRALATSLTVPDQAPTIQAAVDAGVDTVLVQPGTYPETPVIARPVYLMAVPAAPQELPLLAGLEIRVVRHNVSPPVFEFRHLAIQNQVIIVSDYGSCDINFLECELRTGAV